MYDYDTQNFMCPYMPQNSYPDSLARADNYYPPVGMRFYWWGWTLSLDNATTLNLIQYMRDGAVIGNFVKLLAKFLVPLGIIIAILAIGSVLISYINRSGGSKGVYFTSNWIDVPFVTARH